MRRQSSLHSGNRWDSPFQIMDDILNVRPGDEYWGKALAEDITQGKITLQVLATLERAGDTQRQRLIDILQSRTDDSEVLLEAVDIIESSGHLSPHARSHRSTSTRPRQLPGA